MVLEGQPAVGMCGKWARCALEFLMRRFTIESALNHEEQEDS